MSAGDEVYVLTITSFVDDYKPRGGDWSSIEVIKVFSTNEHATKFVRHWLRKWIEDNYGDPDRKKYFDKKGKLKKSVCPIDVLDDFAEGEYVRTRLDWEVRKLTIDADVSTKRQKIKK